MSDDKIDTAAFWGALAKKLDARSMECRSAGGFDTLSMSETIKGPAYTISMRRAASASPGNSRAVSEAFDNAPAGCVVVIEMDGIWGAAIGDLIAHRLRMIGVSGVVTANPIRDVEAIDIHKVPILYRGNTMMAQGGDVISVEVGADIVIDSLTISAGDIVVGNKDGIVLIKPNEVAEITKLAEAKAHSETEWHRKIAAGQTLCDVYFGD